jgi:hypothetical protein
MAEAADDFAAWLEQADIPPPCRTPQLDALLQAVFRFRQQQGSDYYSTRLLSHFLLNCDTGLKVAHIARLLGIARPTASRQQNLSSKQAIHQAHHRMDGRPHGKLLPRFAGPIAAFLLGHPDASRADVLDFIERTFAVRVSRIALYKFLKKYGLQDVTDPAQPTEQAKAAADSSTASPQQSPSAGPTPPVAPLPGATAVEASTASPQQSPSAAEPACPVAPLPGATSAERTASGPVTAAAPLIELASASEPARPQAPPFCSDGRNTPGPSCFSAMPSTG